MDGQSGAPGQDSLVLNSAHAVADAARSVIVRTDRIDAAAARILHNMSEQAYSTATWRTHTLHPKTQDAATIDWIFMVDLLNFSFWPERSTRERFTVSVEGTPYSGYWSLCACIRSALDAGIPITTPAFWLSASDNELRSIFRPDDPDRYDAVPMLDQRIELLRLAGRILFERFDGHFTGCIAQANKSAQKLISLVVEHFGDAFEDVVDFNGQRIYLRKRLQILVADLWACFDGKSYGEFNDINSITMFADYRVPQALLYFGVLEYKPDLEQLLRKHEAYHDKRVNSETDLVDNAANMIPRGHVYEVEIRGCSIWVVELLVRRIREMASAADAPKLSLKPEDINAIVVDFYLWDEAVRNREAMAHLPIHRTRSIYY